METHGALLSTLEEYNDDEYWKNKMTIDFTSQAQEEEEEEEDDTSNKSKNNPTTAVIIDHTVDHKHGDIPWSPPASLSIEDRLFRVACDVIHELHEMLEDDM